MKEKLRNMKVKTKLGIYGACMVVIMLGMGIIALLQSRNMQNNINEITNVWSPSMACAQEMDTITSEYRMKQYGHLVAATKEEKAVFEKELTALDEKLTQLRTDFENKLTLDEERELYGTIESKWDDYMRQSKEVMELSRAGKTEEGGRRMVGEMYSIFEDFNGAFSDLLALEQTELDLAKEGAHNAYLMMEWAIIAAVIVGIILAVWLAMVVTKLIAEPVAQITEASKRLFEGDMSAGKLITYESKDELGHVADSLRGAMKRLDDYVQEISDTLREMAKGDLTKDGDEITEFAGDFASIKESFVYILKRFNSTLTEIQDTSERVSVNAGQISDSSQALSSGAQEQAGGIEEVTKELKHVLMISDESAKDTQAAYDRIRESVANAEEGRKKMEQLTEEMKRIMEISKKIQNISTAVEDIASQTNILSLNASVEAARAGEAGKGFAVVAAQIGKLAADSAQSAIDTRNLIEKALEEISQGNAITAATSEAFTMMIGDMQAFADTARRTNENVKNEALELDEVGQQIDMISGEIQNTAATSEENSAISENLSKEAAALDKMVKRFKLY